MVPQIHRCIFRRPVETIDAAGAATISFVEVFRMPVSFRVERDQLTTEGDIRPSARVAARIRLPFFESVSRGWRVEYQGEQYDVETVRDPYGDRKDLELTVVAVEQ